MIEEISRYQYSLSALWHKDNGKTLTEGLRSVCGLITCDSGDDPYKTTHEELENNYLKSDAGLKMIKDGWSFKLSVSLIMDHFVQVYTVGQ